MFYLIIVGILPVHISLEDSQKRKLMKMKILATSMAYC